MHSTHLAWINDKRSSTEKAAYARARSRAQTKLRDMKDQWWKAKSVQSVLQAAADRHDLKAFYLIWSEESVPQDIKDALNVHIYKRKGDRAVCDDNHPDISLLSVAGQIIARILLNTQGPCVARICSERINEINESETILFVCMFMQLDYSNFSGHDPAMPRASTSAAADEVKHLYLLFSCITAWNINKIG